ncbi:MAG: hypothetical protein ABJO88_13805, partial [Parasphingorhabdus sp.]
NSRWTYYLKCVESFDFFWGGGFDNRTQNGKQHVERLVPLNGAQCLLPVPAQHINLGLATLAVAISV